MKTSGYTLVSRVYYQRLVVRFVLLAEVEQRAEALLWALNSPVIWHQSTILQATYNHAAFAHAHLTFQIPAEIQKKESKKNWVVHHFRRKN